ncbi:NAD-dependent epimerase/dehydratase family protein [Mesorhizobium sp. 1B3]|uniref:NAD-dependent epimerase/dehydratase family protein n=1 Tax=Mesorhizobium sp. 1B3 TaxID=3243599 RepID=UPI003D9909A9
MKVLLTGAAGFIGFHTARLLLERGDTVHGLDNLNDYYDVRLKQARLAALEPFGRFSFAAADIADPRQLGDAMSSEYDVIVHLAAQAGVRYSVENPYAYVHSNVTGQVAIFELAARLGKLPVVYASSSSVYGANDKVPFSETDRVDHPVSVYAATKRAGELLAQAYKETHGLASTGLRFFTVYGRYSRPDMAPWLFTDAILKGRPISVFNNGDMERDFTHVSDIAAGVVASADRIVARPGDTAPVYNLGNNDPVRLLDFIGAIERATGRKAAMEMKPKPAGDVLRTYADITLAERDLGFKPRTRLDDGIADFVEWFRGYNGYPD